MTFDEHIGMHPGEQDHIAVIEIKPHHQNPTGNVNGGVIISLADNLATGVASRHWQEKFGESAFLVGVDLHAVMLGNQKGGTIKATSTPVRVGRRITVIRTEITGDTDQILATVTTTHVPVS